MKWTSLVVLIGLLFFWHPTGPYAVLAQLVVCGSASLVAFQAARSGEHLWAIPFAGLAVLFNPIMAVSFSRGVFWWVNILCVAMFGASLRFLQTTPQFSVQSITYSGSRSQSL